MFGINKSGQSALEYSYLVGILVVALIAVLIYISRGFQGQLRTQADQIGDQYSPGNMNADIVQFSEVQSNDWSDGDVSKSGSTTFANIYRSSDKRKAGYENIRGLNYEK